jgi:hypothetical protein
MRSKACRSDREARPSIGRAWPRHSATGRLASRMTTLTERLLASESRAHGADEGPGRAAFRVCEKLRPLLTTLAGMAGYRSLLARALVLARARVPWLAEMGLDADGALSLPAGIEARLDAAEIARGGSALVDELLGLLSALIGDALTLRLLLNVWPEIEPSLSESPNDLS